MRHALVAIVTLLGLVGRARAETTPEDKAGAEQLFNEARQLLEVGRYAEACPKFEASLKLDPAPGTELNLGDCYEKLGRYASAWGMFRQAADDFRRDSNAGGETVARERATALESRVSRLTLQPVKKAIPGLVVTRNGVVVVPSLLGVAVPVDAGAHQIQCSAPGHKSWTQAIAVGIAESKVLALPDLAPGVTPDPGDREIQITVEQPAEHYEVQLATTGRVLRCAGEVTRDRPCRLTAPAGPAVLTLRGTAAITEDLVVKRKPLLITVDKAGRQLLYGGLVAAGSGVVVLGVGLVACSRRGPDDISDGTATGITCVAGATVGGVAIAAGGGLAIWDLLTEHHGVTVHGDEDDDDEEARRRARRPRDLFASPTRGGAVFGVTGTF